MILLALALQAAAPPAAAPETPTDEVVVIGRKLKDWRASFKVGDKGMTCVTKRSTGDAEIDAIGCTAMRECWPAAAPHFEGTREKGLPRAERKRRMTAAEQAYGSCMITRRDALIEALAEQRTGAGA